MLNKSVREEAETPKACLANPVRAAAEKIARTKRTASATRPEGAAGRGRRDRLGGR
jgi:hypothetical protein